MATLTPSPSGFSYAQAARGRPSTQSSTSPTAKPASGAMTPASATFSELPPSSTWADDVEAGLTETSQDKSSKPEEVEATKVAETKDAVAERTKVTEKVAVASSGISSPDFGSSASITKEDDSSSAPNGSASETTWETKSQVSEPAWIAERKERQNGSNASDNTVKEKKESATAKLPQAPKPAPLHESAPPAVNPWVQRAEAAKAKMATVPNTAVPASSSQESSAAKENLTPKDDIRRKIDPTTPLSEQISRPGPDAKRTSAPNGRRSVYQRIGGARPDAKSGTVDGASPTRWSNSGARSNQAATAPAPPPSTKDEAAWPTPETAQEKEKKETTESKDDVEEKHDDDAAPTKRKKQEWKVMPVVPTVIWETSSMNENKDRKPRGIGGERGRGGSGVRGRGGFRGIPNSVQLGDRSQHQRAGPSAPETSSAGASRSQSLAHDRENMPPPSRPVRNTSAGPYRGGHFNGGYGRRGPSLTRERTVDDSSSAVSGSVTRSVSPKKVEVKTQEPEDVLPKPIPRASSSGPQPRERTDVPANTARDAHFSKPAGPDGRKDSRNFEVTRNDTWPASRGGKRGGRGRGGNGNSNRNGDMSNGHPGSNNNNNNTTGYLAPSEFLNASYTVPPSPSGYAGRSNGHHYGYNQPGRGGWSRNGPRSQSIPMDNFFGRVPPTYVAPPQLSPIQTFSPPMYELPAYPMTAVPYQSTMDQQHVLHNMLTTQLEYYFSLDNLLKDMYLRKHMDSQGFVMLDFVANFNRIKQLTPDRDMVKLVCINSELIDIRVGDDGKERLRRHEDWEKFLLPMEQRELEAQNDGPEQLHYPDRPLIYVPTPFSPLQLRGPTTNGLSPVHSRGERQMSYPMSAYPATYGPYNPLPDMLRSETVNGEETRGRTVKSPAHAAAVPSNSVSVAAGEERDIEPDAFPDEQASVLTVLVKMSDQQRSSQPHGGVSRTFSNGSIDPASLVESKKPVDEATPATDSSNALTNGSDKPLSLSRQASPAKLHSADSSQNAHEMQVYWVKDQEVPAESLPNDLTPEPYVQLRHKALDQRNHAATGTCPYDLDVLYQFWCHFLLRNFNNRMYSEFKHHANEDARERHSFVGLQILVKFYSQALNSHSTIRDRVVKDYVALVQNEPAELEGAAFKAMRSAWRNGALNLKNRKKVSDLLEPTFKEQLDRTET